MKVHEGTRPLGLPTSLSNLTKKNTKEIYISHSKRCNSYTAHLISEITINGIYETRFLIHMLIYYLFYADYRRQEGCCHCEINAGVLHVQMTSDAQHSTAN